jgi:hypothetical protein
MIWMSLLIVLRVNLEVYLGELLSPLQGLLAPTTQIPICFTPVSLPVVVLLVPEVVLEGVVCAFIIVASTDNETRLSAITENKNIIIFFL